MKVRCRNYNKCNNHQCFHHSDHEPRLDRLGNICTKEGHCCVSNKMIKCIKSNDKRDEYNR